MTTCKYFQSDELLGFVAEIWTLGETHEKTDCEFGVFRNGAVRLRR